MDVKLIVINGKHTGQEVPVQVAEFLIGRSAECQLRPRNDQISRRHCAIRVVKNRVTVCDFGSRNGTYVNGERVEGEQELKVGDRVKVGGLELEVRWSVGIGGVRKPKVRSVEEAAARMAQPSGDDEADVAGWLNDGDEDDGADPTGAHPTQTGRTAPSSDSISEFDPVEPKQTEAAPAAQKKTEPPKARDAAADILKGLFNRKK